MSKIYAINSKQFYSLFYITKELHKEYKIVLVSCLYEFFVFLPNSYGEIYYDNSNYVSLFASKIVNYIGPLKPDILIINLNSPKVSLRTEAFISYLGALPSVEFPDWNPVIIIHSMWEHITVDANSNLNELFYTFPGE